jgi:hypothetical protein
MARMHKIMGRLRAYLPFRTGTLKNDRDQLVIFYSGKSDKPTLLNMINHTCFNLSGNLERTILDHELAIDILMYNGNKVIVSGKMACESFLRKECFL